MKRVLLVIILIIILLIRIPPFYIFFESSITQSHLISRVLLLTVLIVYSIDKYRHRFEHYKFSVNIEYLLIALYLVSQALPTFLTLSILNNIKTFIDLSLSCLFYFLVRTVISKIADLSLIIKVIFLSLLINTLFQSVTIFFLSGNIKDLFSRILYSQYYSSFMINIERNKYFGDSFDEIFTSQIILLLTLQSPLISNKIFYFLELLFIELTTFYSNWRTKILMFSSNLIISLFLLLRSRYENIKKYSILLTLAIIVSATVVLNISDNHPTNILQKLIDIGDSGQYETIQSRFNYWEYAIEAGLQSPIIGHGLDSYYDLLNEADKTRSQVLNKFKNKKTIYINDPHNVFLSTFVSSGFVGLTALVILLCYFAHSDFQSLLKYQGLTLKTSFIISFWSLFFFSLLNPSMTYSYQMHFWLLRGIISTDLNKA